MSLILVAKNESGNKQQANPPQPCNLSKGKAILCASPLPIQSLKMSHESHVSHTSHWAKAMPPQTNSNADHQSTLMLAPGQLRY